MGLRSAEEEEDRIITVEAVSTGANEMNLDELAASQKENETPKKNGRRKGKAQEGEAAEVAETAQEPEIGKPMDVAPEPA